MAQARDCPQWAHLGPQRATRAQLAPLAAHPCHASVPGPAQATQASPPALHVAYTLYAVGSAVAQALAWVAHAYIGASGPTAGGLGDPAHTRLLVVQAADGTLPSVVAPSLIPRNNGGRKLAKLPGTLMGLPPQVVRSSSFRSPCGEAGARAAGPQELLDRGRGAGCGVGQLTLPGLADSAELARTCWCRACACCSHRHNRACLASIACLASFPHPNPTCMT